ncbi:hypothetical protein SAMN05444272_3414 [Roseibium suaedae]|uniref:GNAT family N-acetyltransferase n=2 Tax=Roseibium suaedae TaxID=735517 RepID=A0A1M7MHP9_9HYPH|nr:hypothetical protein SAMN05444272_3414 [Roseibium suaedae]
MERRVSSLAVSVLTPDDVDEVSALYANVFRSGKAVRLEEVSTYIREVFLDHPLSGGREGSLLCRDSQGVIAAAVLVLPMTLRFGEDILSGRLLCCLMKNPKSLEANAAIYRLCLALHPRSQDFSFTDTAAPRSVDIFRSGGGEMLPFQTMNWRRVFRPLAFVAGQRFGTYVFAPVFNLIANFGDVFVRKVVSGLRALPVPGFRTADIEVESFRQIALQMTSRHAIRPDWNSDEFAWLVSSALSNPLLGEMRVRSVSNQAGKLIGAYLYFLSDRHIARVFHVVHEEEHGCEVMKALFAELDGAGAYLATGMAQADLLVPLSQEPRLSYRFRGGFCVLSKHAKVIDALRRNDVYLGGFYSESWNRPAMDFN